MEKLYIAAKRTETKAGEDDAKYYKGQLDLIRWLLDGRE